MRNEEIVITNKDSLDYVVSYLYETLEEKKWLVLEVKDYKKRSLPQNALFHMWCGIFAKELSAKGRDCGADEAKVWFKHKFLGYEDISIGKEKIKEQLRHTSDLSPGEMFHFMTEIFDWCSESFGIYLPLPENCEYNVIKEKQEK